MTTKYTSRVWPCWDAVYDALHGATFTPHPLTGVVPPVAFSQTREVAQEMVTVPGMKPPQRPTADFENVGEVSQWEDFTLVVFIWSSVPGYVSSTGDPSRAVRARVAELSATVESTFRSQLTGRQQGITVPGLLWYLVTSVQPEVGPLAEGGFEGKCVIEISFHNRI